MTTPVAAFRFVADASDAIADVRKLKSSVDTLDNSKLNGIGGAFSSLGAQVAGALSVAALANFSKSALDMADAVGDAAAVAGIAVDSMSRLKYLAEQNDVAFSSLTAGVTKYQDTLSNAARDIPEASAALSALGLSAQQLRSIKLEDQLALISDRFRDVKDPADQLRISADLFGKAAGPDMVPLLNIGGSAMLQYMQQAEELGLVLDEKTAAAADRTTKKLEELQNRLSFYTASGLANVITGVEAVAEAFARMIHGADTVQGQLADKRDDLLDCRSSLLKTISDDEETLERSGATAGRVLKSYIDANKRDLALVQSQLDIVNTQLLRIDESRNRAGLSAAPAAQSPTSASPSLIALSEIAVTADGAAQSGADKVREINIALAADLVAIQNRLGQEKLEQQNVFEQMQFDTQALFAQQATDLFNETLSVQTQSYKASLAQRLAEDERAELVKRNLQSLTLSYGLSALQTFAGRSKSAAIASVALNKAWAIAQSIQNTSVGATKALSMGPWGWVSIGAIVAAGAAEIAAIRKTSLGSDSYSGGSGFSLGSPSNPVFANSSSDSTSASSSAQQNSLQIIINGNLFSSPETVDWLMDELKERINNRDSILINANSRQASELFNG